MTIFVNMHHKPKSSPTWGEKKPNTQTKKQCIFNKIQHCIM